MERASGVTRGVTHRAQEAADGGRKRCAAVAATGGLLAARSIWAGYADEARRRIIAPAKAGSSNSKQKQ